MKIKKKRKVYALYLNCCLIYNILFYLVFSVEYVYMLNVVHLNTFQMVMTGVVLQLFCVCFEIPTGIVADRYSRKISAVIGFSITGIGFLIEGAIPHFMAILAAQAIWGIGSTFISGSLQAWVVDEEESVELNKLFLRGAQYEQIGAVIGTILSIIIGNIKECIPILTSGFLFILLAVYLLFVMPEVHFQKVEGKMDVLSAFRSSYYSFLDGFKMILSQRVLFLLLGIALVWGLASEGYDRLWTEQLLSIYHNKSQIFQLTDVTMVGILELLSMLFSVFIIQYVIKKLENSGEDVAKILFSINIINILFLIIFAVSNNLNLMLFSHIMIFTARSMNQPILNSTVNAYISKKIRATALSVYAQVDNIGQIAGGLAVAFISGKFSVSIGILTTVIFLIPALFFILKLVQIQEKV